MRLIIRTYVTRTTSNSRTFRGEQVQGYLVFISCFCGIYNARVILIHKFNEVPLTRHKNQWHRHSSEFQGRLSVRFCMAPLPFRSQRETSQRTQRTLTNGSCMFEGSRARTSDTSSKRLPSRSMRVSRMPTEVRMGLLILVLKGLICEWAVFDKPPYEVSESGWGEFQCTIKLTLHDPSEKVIFLLKGKK